ncbi:MAG: hypothetical protein HQM08_27290 [Candidatus Riflebacteria bacterium]|nr:hypothetical protein [Candidatus Riflebacteria bacterium]
MPLISIHKPSFDKDLSKISQKDRVLILKSIRNLVSSNGKDSDILKIQGILWRLKIGKWRVFFEYDGDIIRLLYVERRTTTTYKKR